MNDVQRQPTFAYVICWVCYTGSYIPNLRTLAYIIADFNVLIQTDMTQIDSDIDADLVYTYKKGCRIYILHLFSYPNSTIFTFILCKSNTVILLYAAWQLITHNCYTQTI